MRKQSLSAGHSLLITSELGDVMVEGRRMVSDHQPPDLERDASPTRKKHLITFGHPYSCTPLLNAIFEFNRSPSHSEVTKIMKQTGLKRKQLTSWFWRKRKELSHPQQSDSKSYQPLSRPNSPGDLSIPKGRVIRSHLKGYSKNHQEEEDDEYRPPGHPVITKSCEFDSHDRFSTGDQSATVVDLRTTPTALTQNQSERKPYHRSHNSQSHLQGVPWTTPPIREPLLLRCRLRPVTERVLTKTTGAKLNDQDGLIENDVAGNIPLKDSGWSSNSIHNMLKEQNTDSFESYENPKSNSPVQQTRCMSDDTPVNSYSYESMQSNHFILPNVNEGPPDRVSTDGVCHSDVGLHHFQLDLEMMPRSQEFLFSTTRRPGSRKTSWLTSDCRLGYSLNNAIETHSRRNSNNLGVSSSSPNINNSNSIESPENICWRVSHNEPVLTTTSNSDLLSLGEEIHRWSEISNIDGASCYSNESIESKESCCTNAAVEDYSALLSISPAQVPLSESPIPQKGCSNQNDLLKNDHELGGTQDFATDHIRYTSNTYRPLVELNRTMNRQNENALLGSTTSLREDTWEIDEDPRLFMWEHHHQEFLKLMDWNPLGSFMHNKSC